MATIFAVYNADGCIGRCDARCHEAKGFDCHCICGGAFHGVGSKVAWQDRMTITHDEIIEVVTSLYGEGPHRVKRVPEQLVLF